MSNPLIVHTSDNSFETDVLKSAEPVLLDFWAEWCGPCKMIGPILDDAARDYQGRVKIVKLNIDESPRHAAEVWRPRHSHADAVQERQGRGAEGRCAVEVPAVRLPGQQPVAGERSAGSNS